MMNTLDLSRTINGFKSQGQKLLGSQEEVVGLRIRHPFLLLRSVLLISLLALACNLSVGVATSHNETIGLATTEVLEAPSLEQLPSELPGETLLSTPAGSQAAPSPNASIQPIGVFKLAVIVDLSSELVSREQAHRVVAEADQILLDQTGIGFTMVDFVEITPDSRVIDLASDYIATHPENLPNGILIFSFGDENTARSYGGYFLTLPAPAGFVNEYVSSTYGDNQIYVAINHFGHRYAACGYGDEEVDAPVQASSFNGECRNLDGVACVENNGYSMCCNAVDNLYASTPTYFTASSIVHEFLHPFGPNGVEDHYYTPTCNQAMAEEASLRRYSEEFSLEESESYNGLCPYVYDNLEFGYRP